MKITLRFLKKHEACDPGYKWFEANKLNWCSLKELYEACKRDKHPKWFICVSDKKMTEFENLKVCVYAAELAIHNWADKYPHDRRPQKAIATKKAYIKDPTAENKSKMEKANSAAYRAANYEANSAPRYAAISAADSEAYYAAYYAASSAASSTAGSAVYKKIALYTYRLLNRRPK